MIHAVLGLVTSRVERGMIPFGKRGANSSPFFGINNHYGSRVIGFKKLRRIVYACVRLVGRCIAKR